MTPGDVHRVQGQPRTAAFRILSIDQSGVHCWGGTGDRLQFRTFHPEQVCPEPLPRSSWPVRLLPREERPEVERKRSERRTARKLAKA